MGIARCFISDDYCVSLFPRVNRYLDGIIFDLVVRRCVITDLERVLEPEVSEPSVETINVFLSGYSIDQMLW